MSVGTILLIILIIFLLAASAAASAAMLWLWQQRAWAASASSWSSFSFSCCLVRLSSFFFIPADAGTCPDVSHVSKYEIAALHSLSVEAPAASRVYQLSAVDAPCPRPPGKA